MLLAIGALTLASVITVYAVARVSVLRGFSDLQDEQVFLQLDQAKRAFRSQVEELDRIVLDWAIGDDSYAFVENLSTDYISSNLVDQTFSQSGLRLHAIVFLSRTGAVVYEKGFNIARNEPAPVPSALTGHYNIEGLLREGGASGLIRLGSQLALVAARPVLASEEQGPSRGTLLMLRLLTDEEVGRLAIQEHMTLTIVPSEARVAVPGRVSTSNSGDVVLGESWLADIYDVPAALLRIAVPDQVMQRGEVTLVTLAWAVGLSGALLAFVAAAIVELTVIRRISILHHNVGNISSGSNQQVIVSGQDELGSLSRQIDSMIRRLRRMEEQRVQSERLGVAGELAAGVSHNLNNMLNGIVGPADMLARSLSGSRETKLLDIIRRSAARATRLVEQLNQVTRPHQKTGIVPVDVNRAVREAIQISRPRWHDEAVARGIGIALDEHLETVPLVNANEGALVDVLINLVFNAVDAMPQGGTVSVRTTQKDGRVMLAVADTGEGMTEGIRMRAFEPFFSTRMTVGSGLGLATVKAAVEGWRGEIFLNSKPGQGTEVCVTLPVSTGKIVSQPRIRPVTAGRKWRVLIAEDDDDVRSTLQLMLPHCDVVVANSGKEAIALLSRQKFDVALVDLGMPDLPGDIVAERAKRCQPGIVTILVTGWAIPPTDPRLCNFDRNITKPVRCPEELLSTMEEALGEKRR